MNFRLIKTYSHKLFDMIVWLYNKQITKNPIARSQLCIKNPDAILLCQLFLAALRNPKPTSKKCVHTPVISEAIADCILAASARAASA